MKRVSVKRYSLVRNYRPLDAELWTIQSSHGRMAWAHVQIRNQHAG